MAKSKGNSAVTLTPDAEPEQDEIESAPEVAGSPVVEPPPPRDVLIELPVREMPDSCYRSRWIEVPGLSPLQADAAKALFEGLHAKQTRLKNGRYVRNVPDAIRWLLEAIGTAK